jgi:hypothetical protein
MTAMDRKSGIRVEDCRQRSLTALRAVKHLFSEDFTAEAMLLAAQTLDSLVAVLLSEVPSIDAASTPLDPQLGSSAPMPASAGLPPEGLDRLRQIGAELRQAADGTSGLSDFRRTALLTDAVTECERVVATLGGKSRWNPRRRLRWAIVGTVFLAILALAFWRAPSPSLHASASASFAKDYGAEQAVDGSAFTEWLLPDNQAGWMDVEFSRPRKVFQVALRNSKNRPFMDRATKDFDLVAYWGDEIRSTNHGNFEAIGKGRDAYTIELGGIEVTRIHIAVLSFHGAGGGLAEVTIK